MANPKVTKSKTQSAPAAETSEFVYEDSDQLYREVMSTGAVGPEVNVNLESEVQAVSTIEYDFPVTQPVHTPPPVSAPVTSSIYLVEGKVRLDQVGSPPTFSDQRRIVNAGSVDEALGKFMNYFASMSNPNQQYTVVHAGAAETIL